MKHLYVTLAIGFFAINQLSAQISLVKDFSTSSSLTSSWDAEFGATLNGYTFFTGQDDHGSELWRTDGTSMGTHRFLDIIPGDLGSSPTHLTTLNDRIVFAATDNVHGTEIWITDGTIAGTDFLRDINPGTASSYPSRFLSAGNFVYFIAYTPTTSTELWRTDGTDEGTILIKDIGVSQVTYETPLCEMNGFIYFVANHNEGAELWKTDGTIDGTQLVKDINPGFGDSNPQNLFSINGLLYFSATDETHGNEPWVSDGTTSGTQLLKDINPDNNNSNPTSFIYLNNLVFFSANDNIHGEELWITDGTEMGTSILLDINPGNLGSVPLHLKTLGSDLIFSARTDSYGRELYKSDGTSSGTQLIIEINPGNNDGVWESADPPVVFGNSYYFGGIQSSSGYELWKTDGTISGTSLVVDLNAGGDGMSQPKYADDNFIYVTGSDGTFGRLYSFDGINFIPITQVQINPESGNPISTYSTGSIMYMSASSNGTGSVLRKSDGTTGGTTVLLNSTSQYVYYPNTFIDLTGGITIFIGSNSIGHNSIYRTNGTQSGTFPLIDTYPGASDYITILGKYNNKVLFCAYDSNYGDELYITDGTVAGTFFVKDIDPGIPASTPNGGVEYNGYYYFNATQNVLNSELWRTDGTMAGTTLFLEINSGNDGSGPGNFAVANGKLLFTAYNNSGVELWTSDGTVAGTHVVKDINNGSASSSPLPLGKTSAALYFMADDGIHGTELWKSDGTLTGTVLMQDINEGTSGSYPGSIFITNNTLYFGANDGTHGYELWKSGTNPNQASLVIDLLPGAASSEAIPWGTINDSIYFSANNNSLGMELWSTDGTTNGTVLCGDLMPGSVGSHPENIAIFNNAVFFSAENDVIGKEFWKYKHQAPILPIIHQTVTSCKRYYSEITGKVYFETALAIDTIQDINNIDSAIVYTSILINSPSYQLDINTACDYYTWINNQTYTASNNTATVHLLTIDGCDSIITLNLTIHESPTATISNNQQGTLTASGGYFYRWYNCVTNMAVTVTQIDSTYTPTENGNYCCVVTDLNGCSDTTACEEVVTDASITQNSELNISIYPNPTNGSVHVQLLPNTTASLTITDLNGRTIHSQFIESSEYIDLKNYTSGIYIFNIEYQNTRMPIKIVKTE